MMVEISDYKDIKVNPSGLYSLLVEHSISSRI